MEKDLLIESTISFGDVYALPIDFLRDLKKKPVSLNFDCLYKMTPKNRDQNQRGDYDQTKIPFDSIKFRYERRNMDLEFLSFSLKKICYQLKPEGKGIQNLKMIYLNNDGKEEVLLDTSEGKQGITFETIEFEDGEIIEGAIVYEQAEGFCALDITTNKKKNYMIGQRVGENTNIFLEEKYKNKVIVGLGCWANEQDGVTCIYFYLVDKKTYSICQTYGMRQLRAKIQTKKDKAFIEGLEKLRQNLNNEQKLLSDVCGLPDPVYFTVLKYVMPY